MEEKTAPETPEADTPELSPSEKVESEYNKVKESNDKLAAELLRAEELRAKVALGGQTTSKPQEPPREETPAEYRARIDREIREGKHNE